MPTKKKAPAKMAPRKRKPKAKPKLDINWIERLDGFLQGTQTHAVLTRDSAKELRRHLAQKDEKIAELEAQLESEREEANYWHQMTTWNASS